jgi:hypothetical protein
VLFCVDELTPPPLPPPLPDPSPAPPPLLIIFAMLPPSSISESSTEDLR